MKGRPAKRQKRHVLRSSDSDGSDHHGSDSSSSYTKSPAKRTVSSSPATKKQQPARNTRAKAKSKPETRKDGGMKQADLSSFYKKATHPPETPPKAPKPVKEEPDYVAELEDDLIQDDDLDALMLEAEHRSQQSQAPTLVESSQASRTKSAAQPPKQNLPVRRLHVFGDAGSVASTKDPATAKDLPWVQRWPPRTLEELGVHKKKVQDVRTWLERALSGDPHKRLLVLRGPPGSGKTATIESLGSVLNFAVSEWRNLLDTTSSSGARTSMVASFEEFLGRGEHYGSLQLASTHAPNPGSHPAANAPSDAQKVLVVEEFPSSLFGGGSAVNSFRDAILRLLAIQPTTPLKSFLHPGQRSNLNPVIIIVSESATLSSGEGADAFTAHRLLGPDILAHPAVTAIDFNPVAPTLLLKILELTLKKAAPTGRERKAFATSHLRALAESGDIRSAIAALEYLFIAQSVGQTQASISQTLAIGAIAQREATLELFHAVGKVVYNKRKPAGKPSPPSATPPPDTLVSDFDVQHVIDETGRDATTFVAALHENYAPSCAGPDFVDRLAACVSALSDADLLSPDALGSRPSGAGLASASLYAGSPSVDALRQSGIATAVAVRGLLAALPHPVQRKPAGDAARNSFRMFYPESMRVRGRAAECAAAAAAAVRALDRQRGEGEVAARSDAYGFVLETAPFLARIRGGAVRGLDALVSYESLRGSGWKGAASGGAGEQTRVLGKRLAGEAASKATVARAQMDLSASISERLYLSDDDIED